MEVKTIIQEIQQLPLGKRFLIMEQTLKSIKKEELKQETESDAGEFYANDKELASYKVNERSLAKEWLSEEDSRWDNLL